MPYFYHSGRTLRLNTLINTEISKKNAKETRPISRIKKMLWLVTDGSFYRLGQNVVVTRPEQFDQSAVKADFGNFKVALQNKDVHRENSRSSSLEFVGILSRRQQKALALIEKNGELSATEFAKAARVTRMTAYRDLQSLVALDLVFCVGKARSSILKGGYKFRVKRSKIENVIVL